MSPSWSKRIAKAIFTRIANLSPEHRFRVGCAMCLAAVATVDLRLAMFILGAILAFAALTEER